MRSGAQFAAWLRGSKNVLVIHLGDGAVLTRRAASRGTRLTELDLTDPVPEGQPWDAVVLEVEDLRRLRTAATGLATHGRSTRLALLLRRPTALLPVPTPRAEWPTLVGLRAAAGPHPFVALDFDAEAPCQAVFTELARLGRHDPVSQWPTLGTERDTPARWPAAGTVTTVARPRRLTDTRVDFPSDVTLVEVPVSAGRDDQPHPVLARAPTVVVRPEEPTWAQAAAAGTLPAWLLGPVDDRLVNPAGFDRAAGGGVRELVLDDAEPAAVAGADGRLGEVEVASVRGLQGLRLSWRGGHGPVAYARAVAHLAAAGVPLLSDGPAPEWAGQLLGALAGELVDAAEGVVRLEDPLWREELSVRQRRLALRRHRFTAWRASLPGGGTPAPYSPRVSVVLATKRPEMLRFALRQVARQDVADLELVLLTHGFEPEPGELAEFATAAPHAQLVAVPVAAEVVFGEVLNEGVAHASGDLVAKMDDDDWYAPQFLSDLVLARDYSGADLVGCASEFTFVAPRWLTTRRDIPSEVYRPWLAGGTLMMDRGLLRGLGGFRPVRRSVDASLLQAVRASGATTYRTHGLGYLLRRGAHGHTWDPGLDYFVDEARAPVQLPGFTPSALLEVDPRDLPQREEVGPA